MARRSKRPKIVVGQVRARAIRGPKDGRWYWRAEHHQDGSSRTVWTGWATKAEAQKIIAQAVADGLEHQRLGIAPIRTVTDMLECWVGEQNQRVDISSHTLQAYTNAARHLVGDIGSTRLDRLDLHTMERYRDRRLRGGGATGTVTVELRLLRMVWRWGREVGACPSRDLPRVSVRHKPANNRRTPSHADVINVLGQLSGWPRIAVRILFATGARIGEIKDLRWSDVHLERRTIRLEGKTGERVVPLLDDLVAELRDWRGDAQSHERVHRVAPKTVRVCLRKPFLERACNELGIPAFTPHALRRAAVDQLARAGVDVGTAAALFGHSPAVMLGKYRRVTDEDQRRAIEMARLGAIPAGEVIPFKTGARR